MEGKSLSSRTDQHERRGGRSSTGSAREISDLTRSDSDPKQTGLKKKRDAFLMELMQPSSARGSKSCRLCKEIVWGPNGRYHMLKCPVICKARAKASREGIKLVNIGGVHIHEELFPRTKPPKPKPAKWEGFVMSNSALRDDPRVAPSAAERQSGIHTGRKGYTRCIACNAEIYAPNTKRHLCS